MIGIVCAMRCEANPFIKYFSLKKQENILSFEVFASESLVLVISGTESIASGAAVSALLCTYTALHSLYNIGIAGGYEKSGVYRISSVRYGNQERYPESAFSTLPLASLITKDEVQTSLPQDSLIDMEGFGFFEVASKTLPLHAISLIKVVSDAGETETISPQTVETLIQKNLPRILPELKGYEPQTPVTLPEELLLLEPHFTLTQWRQFSHLCHSLSLHKPLPIQSINTLLTSSKKPPKRRAEQVLLYVQKELDAVYEGYMER